MKLKERLATLFFLLLVLPLPAVAIGIGPSAVFRSYQPNSEETIGAFVLSNSDRDQTYTILLKDNETRSKVTLLQETVFVPAHGKGDFEFKVTMPEDMFPGRHVLSIGVMENTPSESEGWISALASVFMVVVIDVPIPGVYAVIGFDAFDVNEGEKEQFHINLINRGSETIRLFTGTITVSTEGSPDATLQIPSRSNIRNNERVDIIILWDTKGKTPGIYSALAAMTYEGKQENKSANFLIGKQIFTIINFTDTIQAGKINNFNILLQSKWNNAMQGVYADVIISKDGQEVMKTKTSTIDLQGWKLITLEAFLDASNMEEGEYEARVIVHYQDKIVEKTGPLHVVETRLLGIEMPKPAAMIGLVVLVFVILLATLINIILLLKKRKEGKGRK